MQGSLEQYKQKINTQIADFFSERINSEENSTLKGHYIKIRDFVLRDGKRLRPIISLIAYSSITGQNPEKIFLPAISTELLHAGTLIQDDIMDEDTLRRNKPSMHKIMQDIFLEDTKDEPSDRDIFKNKSSRFGVSMAILHGNLLFFLGKKAILESKISDDAKQKLLKKYNDACTIVNEGQILDITYALTNEVSVEEYISMVKRKTASLFIYSAQTGAILSDGNQKQIQIQIQILSEIFEKFAVAFQIKDDLQDLEKSPSNNTFGSDIKKGNMTLPVIYALNNSTISGRKKLDAILGKSDLSDDEILEIIKILRDSKGIQFAEKLAEEQIQEAKTLLEKNKKLFKKTDEIFVLINCVK